MWGRKIEKWLCTGKIRQEEGQIGGRKSRSVDEGNKKSDACVWSCAVLTLLREAQRISVEKTSDRCQWNWAGGLGKVFKYYYSQNSGFTELPVCVLAICGPVGPNKYEVSLNTGLRFL